MEGEELKKSIDQINRFYQKLIEYYSARANPYYLIYVHKLNSLYSKYYPKSSSRESARDRDTQKERDTRSS